MHETNIMQKTKCIKNIYSKDFRKHFGCWLATVKIKRKKKKEKIKELK